MKRSKRYNELIAKIDRNTEYGLIEGVNLLKSVATARFDETVELAFAQYGDYVRAELPGFRFHWRHVLVDSQPNLNAVSVRR